MAYGHVAIMLYYFVYGSTFAVRLRATCLHNHIRVALLLGAEAFAFVTKRLI